MMYLKSYDITSFGRDTGECFRYESVDTGGALEKIGDPKDDSLSGNLKTVFRDIDSRSRIISAPEEDPDLLVLFRAADESLVAGDDYSYNGREERVSLKRIRTEIELAANVETYDDPHYMAQLDIIDLDEGYTVLHCNVGGDIFLQVTTPEIKPLRTLLGHLGLLSNK